MRTTNKMINLLIRCFALLLPIASLAAENLATDFHTPSKSVSVNTFECKKDPTGLGARIEYSLVEGIEGKYRTSIDQVLFGGVPIPKAILEKANTLLKGKNIEGVTGACFLKRVRVVLRLMDPKQPAPNNGTWLVISINESGQIVIGD